MAFRRVASHALILGAVLLAGCATPSRAPVMDRSEPAPPPAVKSSAEYIVRPNDSLYAIAWKYKLNYRDLARRNDIRPPYTIYPGQKLVLYGMKSEQEPVTTAPETGARRPAATARRPATASTPAPRAPEQATKPTSQPKPAAKASPQSKPAAKPAPRPQTRPPAAQNTARVQSGHAGWRWPVNAQPARGFGRGNNGLDYVLASGQQVVAAAAGRVVYAGPGLGGYRHLIIVEHPGNYLSAYNVNVEPATAEGSRIDGGSKICDIGSGSPATRRLHFEIRRNGTPVNPALIIGRR